MIRETAVALRAELNEMRDKPQLSIADVVRVNEISEIVSNEVGERSRRTALDGLGTPVETPGRSGDVSTVLEHKGWQFGTTTLIEVGSKALIDSIDDARPRRETGILREIEDTRYVFPPPIVGRHFGRPGPQTGSHDPSVMTRTISVQSVLAARRGRGGAAGFRSASWTEAVGKPTRSR